MALFCWGGRALCRAQNLTPTFCPAEAAEHAAPRAASGARWWAKDVEPKVHGKIQEKTQARSSKNFGERVKVVSRDC